MTLNAESIGEQVAPLSDDLLYGANEIAKFLGCTQRKVFYFRRMKFVPLGSIGGQIVGSKAVLRRHFAAIMVEAE